MTKITQKDIVISELTRRWVRKHELAEFLGLTFRDTRRYLANLNEELKQQGLCVLSSAKMRGYHIPTPGNYADMELAIKASAELKKKAVSIFQRRQAIEKFIKGEQ